jgi:hypothetical protein
MTRINTFSTSAALLIFVLCLASPVSGAAPSITWTKNTVVVDSNTAQAALSSVSTDGHVLVFNTTDKRILNLAAGQILILEDLGARRVMGVLRQGPLTAVATNAAGLTEFIQDGTIQFPNASRNPTILNQQDTDEYGLVGEVNEWKYKVKSESENNDLDFSFNAVKSVGTLTATVEGKGDLKNNGFSFLADIHDAKLQKLLYTAPIEGSLKVNWSAITSGSSNGIGENRLQMPPLFKELFVVSHLPFLYQINANLIFTPGLGGKKDAVKGGFEVKYKGNGGFTATASQSAPVREMEAIPASIDETKSSALAPHGIVLAVNAPKIAFSFGTESFMEAVHQTVPTAIKNKQSADGFEARLANVLTKDKASYFKTEGGAYVQWVEEYDYTGSGPLSVVPCTTTHFNLIASGGVDAKILGLSSDDKFELYNKNWTTTDPDVPACKIK